MNCVSRIAFAFVVGVALFSCKREDTSLSGLARAQSRTKPSIPFYVEGNASANTRIQSKLLTTAEIQKIGLLHNKALSSVLSGLKRKSVSHFKSNRQVADLIIDELDGFCRRNFDSKDEISFAHQLLVGEVSKCASKNSTTNLSPSQAVIKENSARLSEDQIALLKACYDALDSAYQIGIASSTDKLDQIQCIARAKLPAAQAQAVWITAAVGKASLSYWHKNINAWRRALNADGWFSWCKLGGADAAGAGSCAVGGAVAAAIPSLGITQAAYIGGIAIGAAGASAYSAIEQIWDHYCCGCEDKGT